MIFLSHPDQPELKVEEKENLMQTTLVTSAEVVPRTITLSNRFLPSRDFQIVLRSSLNRKKCLRQRKESLWQ